MQLRKFLETSSLILLSSFTLTGCGSLLGGLLPSIKEPEKIVTVTNTVKAQLTKAERPKPIKMNDVGFKVVTRENLEQFIKDWEQENGEVVFFAMGVRDYESMALNIGELRRYLLQQKEIIIFYEKQVDTNNGTPEPKPEAKEENNK